LLLEAVLFGAGQDGGRNPHRMITLPGDVHGELSTGEIAGAAEIRGVEPGV
jgi:hypothetical protein